MQWKEIYKATIHGYHIQTHTNKPGTIMKPHNRKKEKEKTSGIALNRQEK